MEKRKKIFGRTDEIDILIVYYKDLESEYLENERPRNDIIDYWMKYLIKLNNKNINL